MSGADKEDEAARLGIGALSEATGVPVDTLRTWERRYGAPKPERTASGHRRYRPEAIEYVRFAQRAIEAGRRASQALGLPIEELRAIAGALPRAQAPPSFEERGPALEALLGAVRRFDEAVLDQIMERSWYELGPVRAIEELLAPAMRAVGAGWESGELVVLQEQFASRRLAHFLEGHWRAMAMGCEGPRALLCAPRGEHHVLGLHMAAVAIAAAGWCPSWGGADLEADEIAQRARGVGAAHVFVGVSCGLAPHEVRGAIASIQGALEQNARLIVGGSGAAAIADELGESATYVRDINALTEWLRDRSRS